MTATAVDLLRRSPAVVTLTLVQEPKTDKAANTTQASTLTAGSTPQSVPSQKPVAPSQAVPATSAASTATAAAVTQPTESQRRETAKTTDIGAERAPTPEGLQRTVVLTKSAGQTYGLEVLAREDSPGPVFVTVVRPNGAAAECKRLHEGDRILAINDSSTESVTQGETV